MRQAGMRDMMEEGRVTTAPLLRFLFQNEEHIYKEVEQLLWSGEQHGTSLSSAALTSLKEKLLSHPQQTSSLLQELMRAQNVTSPNIVTLPETSLSGPKEKERDEDQSNNSNKLLDNEGESKRLSEVRSVYVECLDHCLRRVENLEEKLQKEEEEHSSIIRRQQKSFSPMRSNFGLTKQKHVEYAEASKVKERIVSTNVQKLKNEHLFYLLLALAGDNVGHQLYHRMLQLCYERNLLVASKLHLALLSGAYHTCRRYFEQESDYILDQFKGKEDKEWENLYTFSASMVRDMFHACSQSSNHILDIIFKVFLCSSWRSLNESDLCDEFPWISPLQPLLFMQVSLFAKDKLQDCVNISSVLKKHSSAVDSLLVEVCKYLERDMKLVGWCLAQNSKIKSQNLLQLARDHSPLYVMQKALALHTLPPTSVLKILKEHCMARDASGSLYAQSQSAFTSFCVLFQVIEVIGFGMQLDNIAVGWQARNKSHVSKIPNYDGTNSFQDRQSHSLFYQQNIAERLKGVKKMLDSLLPLECRLTVMENVYSLLFVRHNDMSDESQSESGGEEEDPSCVSPSTDVESLASTSLSTTFHQPHVTLTEPSKVSVHVSEERGAREKQNRAPDIPSFSGHGMRVAVMEKCEGAGSSIDSSDSEGMRQSWSSGALDKNEGANLSTDAERKPFASCGKANDHLHYLFSGTATTTTSHLSSCAMSGKSTGSSVGELPRMGFLVNVLVAWDVLLLLQDSLLAFTAECYKQSASDPSLKSRTSCLSRYVNEAVWRLQFLILSSHAFAAVDIFDDYLDGVLLSQKSKLVVYEADVVKDHPRTVSRQISSVSSSKKKFSREHKLGSAFDNSLEFESIMNYLLAPPSSLITLSLDNGNVDKIEQIFHMNKIGDTMEKREAYLALGLKQLREKLFARCQDSSKRPKVVKCGSHGREPLQNLGLLAREGSAQVGATNLIHDLVTSCPPPVPPGLTELAGSTVSPMVASFLTPQSLVLTDLALTVDLTHTTFLYLTEQVLLKQAGHTVQDKHTSSSSGIIGYISVLKSMKALCSSVVELKEAASNEGGQEEVGKGCWPTLPNLGASPTALLLSSYPLKEVDLKNSVKGWSKLLSNFLCAQHHLCFSSGDENSQISVHSSKNEAHVAYKALLHTLSEETTHLWTVCSKLEANKMGAYVRSFYQYLQLLSAMVSQHTHKPISKQKYNYFHLLKQQPVQILGSLMFEEEIDPMKLENIAARMRINLTSMILQYCCLNFPVAKASMLKTVVEGGLTEKAEALGFVMEGGHVIMNGGGSDSGGEGGVYGEVVVRDLLTTLLSALQESVQSMSYTHNPSLRATVLHDASAANALASPDVKVALKDTVDLASVDLQKMAAGNEAVVFFLNLANLMVIHAGLLNHLLYPHNKSTSDHRGIFSKFQLERVIAMKRLGYIVGQMGFVSLYDLLYNIVCVAAPLSSVRVQHTPAPCLTLYESSLIGSMSEREKFKPALELLSSLPPKATFCVSTGSSVSPRVQVLYADRLEEQMDAAVQEHTRHFLSFSGRTSLMARGNKGTCCVCSSRTLIDYLAQHPESVAKAIESLQQSAPEEDGDVIHTLKAEIEECKYLELSVLDKYENRGVVLEFDEPLEKGQFIVECDDEHGAQPQTLPVTPAQQFPVCDKIPLTVLTYLRRQCPLLSFVVQVYHSVGEGQQGVGTGKTAAMEYGDNWLNILYPPVLGIKPPSEETKRFSSIRNLFSLSKHSALAKLYDDNIISSALYCEEDVCAVWGVADQLVGSGTIIQDGCQLQAVQQLVTVLQSLSARSQQQQPDLTLLLDHLIVFLVQSPHASANAVPWRLAATVSDSSLRYSTIMKVHKECGVSEALELLNVLASDPQLSVEEQTWAGGRTRQLLVYNKISMLCSAPYKSWQEVERASVESPTTLLQCLIQRKQFKLSMEWAQHHPSSDHMHRLIDQSYLLDMLDKTNPDYDGALEALEALQRPEALAVVVHELLQRLSDIVTRKFLIEVYLQKQQFHLEILDKENGNSNDTAGVCAASGHPHVPALLQELMGLILIVDLAPAASDRFHLMQLVTRPHLILEQWLMNVKLEAIEKAIQALGPYLDMIGACTSSNAKTCSSGDSQNTPGLSWDVLNGMLEVYAAKALDMTGVQVAIRSSSSSPSTPKKFVMPPQPPRRSEWVLDEEVRKCPVCEVAIFSMFCRRHHCRRCGRVVCSACSPHRSTVQGYDGLQVRVCTDCHNQTKEQNVQNFVQIRPLGEDGDGSQTGDGNSAQGRMSSSSDLGGWYLSTDTHHNDIIRQEFSFDYAPSLSLCLAILSYHQNHKNAAICIISLCQKLFSLIISSIELSSPAVDLDFVLTMIRTLLTSSKVRFGYVNDQQGIGLSEYYAHWMDLLSILLKSNCSHIIPNEALENMLHVGNLLLKNLRNETDYQVMLGTQLKQEGFHIRRIRDLLVKEQKWELALEISTKARLETNGVWGAWAMASLKAGDFPGARDRFSRILERPVDKNRPCRSSLLPEVIKYLESNPFCVDQQVMDQAHLDRSSAVMYDKNKLSPSQALVVLHTLKNLNNIVQSTGGIPLSASPKSGVNTKAIVSNNFKMEPLFQKECKYYLSVYGNHSMMIQYFMRNKQIQGCAEYMLNENIDLDIFIEEVLIPILRRGQLGSLMTSLYALDPHMEKWGKLMLGGCRWLERNCWWNCLLALQEAVGDRVRASMTLLRMYTDGVTCYTTLASRCDLITAARTHLQAYLDCQALHNSSPKRKTYVLNLSAWQVNQNIHMLTLQIEVTKFLAACESQDASISALLGTLHTISLISKKQLPTLLTNDEGRLAVTTLVICGAKNLADGLNLAYRIVERTQVPVEKLLSLCCQLLVRQERWDYLQVVVRGIQEWEILSRTAVDTALRPAILVMATSNHNTHLDTLVKLLSSDNQKMETFIECGRLKSAYLIAVHQGSVVGVQRVQEVAQAKKQAHIAAMCSKWLANHHN